MFLYIFATISFVKYGVGFKIAFVLLETELTAGLWPLASGRQRTEIDRWENTDGSPHGLTYLSWLAPARLWSKGRGTHSTLTLSWGRIMVLEPQNIHFTVLAMITWVFARYGSCTQY